MAIPADISQGTNSTQVNPTNWNALVNGINNLKDYYSKTLVYDVTHPDYGAVGDGNTNDRTAIDAASTAAGVGKAIYFPPGTYLISTSLTIVADCIFANGAKLSTPSGQTVTITGGVYASRNQIFSGLGAYSLTTTPEIWADWFGFSTSATAANNSTSLQNAVNATPNMGTLRLNRGSYSFGTTGVAITNKNLNIIGMGRGNTNTASVGTKLTFTGTLDAFKINGTSGNMNYGSIRDIEFNSDTLTGGYAFIRGTYAHGLVLERLYFYQLTIAGALCIFLDNSYHVTIRDCNAMISGDGNGILLYEQCNGAVISGGRWYGGSNSVGGYGLEVEGSGGVSVLGTIFENWVYGIKVGTLVDDVVSNVSLFGCYFEINRTSHIWVGQSDLSSNVNCFAMFNCYSHSNSTGTTLFYIEQCNGLMIKGGRHFNDTNNATSWWFGAGVKNAEFTGVRSTLTGTGQTFINRNASATGWFQTGATTGYTQIDQLTTKRPVLVATTIPKAVTVTFNMDNAAIYKLTLTASVKCIRATNGTLNQRNLIRIIDSATGGHLVTATTGFSLKNKVITGVASKSVYIDVLKVSTALWQEVNRYSGV